MVSILAAAVNAVNILLCAGMVIYAKKWLHIFRGGMMQRGLEILLASVIFFLVAAIARAALIWNIIPPELDFVDISIRTIAFVCLFTSIALIVRKWTNFSNKT
jgi:hypothetical protein